MKNNTEGFKWTGGSDEFNLTEGQAIDNELQRLGQELQLNIAESVRAKGLVASGSLISDNNFVFKFGSEGEKKTMELYMNYYADFINQGVQGVVKQSNAPGSPYKFKSFGMSADGRKNIIKYIQSGKAKVRNVKYAKEGLERKVKTSKKSDIEKQADALIGIIKAVGIKRTDYLDEAVAKTFKDIDAKIVDAFNKDIFIRLKEI
jgi:hypothetical protein